MTETDNQDVIYITVKIPAPPDTQFGRLGKMLQRLGESLETGDEANQVIGGSDDYIFGLAAPDRHAIPVEISGETLNVPQLLRLAEQIEYLEEGSKS